MHPVTFCGKERIMTTNIKKFLENYKLIMAYRSEYVQFEYWGIRKTLEICVCTESFIQDGIRVEKGCIYGITNLDSNLVLYELTGRWGDLGHSGDFLSTEAQKNGIKGWNIYSKFGDNFKELGLSTTHGFLYKEE